MVGLIADKEIASSFSILTNWISNKWLILLTSIIVPITFLDVFATLNNIQAYGLGGEFNFIFRWFYLNNLVWLFFFLSATASLLAFAIFGSLYNTAPSNSKSRLAAVFAFVWTVRLTASLYGAGTTVFFLEDPRFLLLIAIPAFLGVWLLLRYEAKLTWTALKSRVKRFQDDFSDALLHFNWGRSRQQDTPAPPEIKKLPKTIIMVRSKTPKKAIIAGIFLVIIPLIVVPLGFQALFQYLVMNIEYPWYREIGIVSQIQGIVFLASIFFSLAIIAVMIYLVITVFENLFPEEIE